MNEDEKIYYFIVGPDGENTAMKIREGVETDVIETNDILNAHVEDPSFVPLETNIARIYWAWIWDEDKRLRYDLLINARSYDEASTICGNFIQELKEKKHED